MRQKKLSQSKKFRFAMIPIVLLCLTASGCADEQPAGLKTSTPVVKSTSVPFNRFFTAWSRNYVSGAIQTQIFGLDARQDRQFIDWYVTQEAMAFARANPGRLYVDGDEPDQYCATWSAYDYAGVYHDFVAAIRSADPTARVSPAGFAEANPHCCPGYPDIPCAENHGISYADQFYNAYIQRYGVAPPVDEWQFHDFGVIYDAGDMTGWWGRVDKEAAWSVAHGAKMFLGGWGLHGWPAKESPAAFQEHLKQAMGRLMNDPRIVGAAYWSYEPWVDAPRPLVDASGSLTAEGNTYANPLTDIPADVRIVASANGTAKVQWTNTTAAWGGEAEFWVQTPGSSSFVYRSTELVPGPGATQTLSVAFNGGETVKARVRYYNVFGQAPWSSFSNTVALTQAASGPETGVPGKRPLFCKLQLC
jgi:hypothetical protein